MGKRIKRSSVTLRRLRYTVTVEKDPKYVPESRYCRVVVDTPRGRKTYDGGITLAYALRKAGNVLQAWADIEDEDMRRR